MRILFSPIGTADPLTGLGDGPMLHIVRHYLPEKVELFLSPKMAEYQRRDQRYTRAIDKLVQETGQVAPTVCLVESKQAEVFRLDHYIEEFERILEDLVEEAGPEGELLVNVTSGTSGMTQALVALGAFGRLGNVRLLQVTSPRKGINKSGDREDPDAFDLDLVWEANEGRGRDEKESRISEVETPNFADRLLRENAITLVRNYEYEAAEQLVGQMSRPNPSARNKIRAAAERMNLVGERAAREFKGTAFAFRPDDMLAEYLYGMEARLKQRRWADFLRSMTPALTEIMKRCLRKAGLPENKYLQMEGSKPSDRLDFGRIDADARLKSVLGSYDHARTTYISNAMLVALIEEYCKDDAVVKKISELREVEQKCRNGVAHKVRSSEKKKLEDEAGMGLERVMSLLFELHGSAERGVYGRMSEAIISEL